MGVSDSDETPIPIDHLHYPNQYIAGALSLSYVQPRGVVELTLDFGATCLLCKSEEFCEKSNDCFRNFIQVVYMEYKAGNVQ